MKLYIAAPYPPLFRTFIPRSRVSLKQIHSLIWYCQHITTLILPYFSATRVLHNVELEVVQEWLDIDHATNMYPMVWKEMGISKWELSPCLCWLDLPTWEDPNTKRAIMGRCKIIVYFLRFVYVLLFSMLRKLNLR